MARVGGDEKRDGRLVVAAGTSGKLAEWRRFQRKNLNILDLPKRKEWPWCHKMSSWQVRRRQVRRLSKRNRGICPDHQIVPVRKERLSPTSKATR